MNNFKFFIFFNFLIALNGLHASTLLKGNQKSKKTYQISEINIENIQQALVQCNNINNINDNIIKEILLFKYIIPNENFLNYISNRIVIIINSSSTFKNNYIKTSDQKIETIERQEAQEINFSDFEKDNKENKDIIEIRKNLYNEYGIGCLKKQSQIILNFYILKYLETKQPEDFLIQKKNYSSDVFSENNIARKNFIENFKIQKTKYSNMDEVD